MTRREEALLRALKSARMMLYAYKGARVQNGAQVQLDRVIEVVENAIRVAERGEPLP